MNNPSVGKPTAPLRQGSNRDTSVCPYGRGNDKQNKIKRYMKKSYVSPLMIEVNVEAEAMLAASLKMDGNKTVDTSDGGQLGKENDRQWGNLWN